MRGQGDELLSCRVRGRLKEKGIDIFVGDMVEVERTGAGEGVIENVLARKNRLRRPLVSNIDQVIALVAVKDPPLDLLLLDRIVLTAEEADIDIVICFSKTDLMQEEDSERFALLAEVYRRCGYMVFFTSTMTGAGFDDLEGALEGKVTVLAGPSGAGKSTLVNTLKPGLGLLSSPVSEKNRRGRQTTRDVSLINLYGDAFIVDTPGFQRLDLKGFTVENLAQFFPEMNALHGLCRFTGCLHMAEPDCAVKDALEKGRIALWRYEHYQFFLKEIKERERVFVKKGGNK